MVALLTHRRPRLRGLSRRPGPALREAADDRGHPTRRPRSSTSRSRPRGTRSRAPRSRAPPSRSRRPGRDPYQVTATSDGVWAAQVDLRRGRNQFDVSALDPETGKKSEETLQLFITVPFLVIEAPTLTRRPAGRGRVLRERRDPGRRPDDQRDRRSWSAAPGSARSGPPGSPSTPPATSGEGDRAGRRRRVLQHALELTAGRWAITVTASSAGGQDRRPDPPRDRRLQGREPRRHGQGRPGLDQGLGRRQDRSEGRCRGQGHRQRQDPDLHRHAIDRGPDGLVGGDLLHPQRHVAGRAREVGGARDMAVRATRQPEKTQRR